MKLKAIIIAGVASLAVAGLFWYWQSGRRQIASPVPQGQSPVLPQDRDQSPLAAPAEEGLGAQVFEKTQNPVSGEVPQANPIKEVKTNPFKDEYVNPFE